MTNGRSHVHLHAIVRVDHDADISLDVGGVELSGIRGFTDEKIAEAECARLNRLNGDETSAYSVVLVRVPFEEATRLAELVDEL